MVLLAMQFSLHHFEALEDSKLQQMLRDIYKVLHTEVLKILPCTEKLRIDSSFVGKLWRCVGNRIVCER